MLETSFQVAHVRYSADKPFSDVTAAFEQRIGRFDPEVQKLLADGGDPATVRSRFDALAGPSGFMLFSFYDHGALLRLAGQKRKARQYIVGNPLFAVEMTRHALGAALYAPLRVLISEDDAGATSVEYDRPSSLFGQFGNAKVDETARDLDRKLAKLAEDSLR